MGASLQRWLAIVHVVLCELSHLGDLWSFLRSLTFQQVLVPFVVAQRGS